MFLKTSYILKTQGTISNQLDC